MLSSDHKTIKIEACQQKDNQAASEFFTSIYNEMGWGITPSEGVSNPLVFFQEHKGWLLLAKENEKVIGTSGIVPLSDGNGLLKRFYIHPDYRGTEVASKLFQHSESLAKQKHFKQLFLDVRRDNTRAVRLWEKNGFILFTPKRYDEWDESFTLQDLRFYYRKPL